MDTIQRKFEQLKNTPSDIWEHLQTLHDLASQCDTIVELGVRTGLSTYALLAGMDKTAKMTSYDFVIFPQVYEILSACKRAGLDWTMVEADTRKCTIPECDLLWIDTLHNGSQLEIELELHASKAKRFIAFHDTTTYGEKGETEEVGLQDAMTKYLAKHPERKVRKVYTNNNGLTIWEKNSQLTKVSPTKPGVVTVFTAIYNEFDILKLQPTQTIPCRFVCFTNGKLKMEQGAEKQWEIVKDTNREHLHPRMRAKRFRTHSQDVFEGGDMFMYIDGSGRIQKNDTVEHFVKQFLNKSDILCFEHPERHCIQDEADFVLEVKRNKYKGLPIKEQAQYYASQGFPNDYGLTATGMLIFRYGNEKTKQFFKDWRTECLTRTYQDQISFDYLVWKNKIHRSRVQEDLRKNRYINFLSPHQKQE